MGDRAARGHRDGGRRGGRVRAWIAGELARLRADLSPAARNHRILHRLTALSEAELHRIGLAREDLHEARLGEIRDASRLLLDRREARREGVR